VMGVRVYVAAAVAVIAFGGAEEKMRKRKR
jgi:hypothetical protein